MEIGTVVQVKANKSVFDCCQGKRGRITHRAVGGGWLLNTDHFCPVAREDADLEEIPLRTLAEEHLAKKEDWIRKDYEEADSELLKQYSPRDVTAWAVLILRDEVEA